jgi:hypothetical protein
MLNYNLNIIEPLKQDKKNEDVRPDMYWSFESYASSSDSSDLGELGFATMSIDAPQTNCIQVSNDDSGLFATDAQYPVTSSLTGSNWPITGSTTMSLYTAGITYDPSSVNQYYYAAVSASALDIYNNPNITGSILKNNYSASEFFRFYTEARIYHTKGNVYNPIVNWKAINQSPSTDTGNVNGFTASFNIVKDKNVSLVALPEVTGSTIGAFNNEYALNITSSLSASVINDATGSTTMSIVIPNAGISTSSLLFNSSSAGLQTISASFTASNNNDYNITASVIMNKGNIWNARLNVLSTGSNADSYSMYTIPTQFNIFKDVNVDGAIIDQNVNLLSNALTTSRVDTLQTNYAFNFQNDVTESGTYPVYQVFTYPTTSLNITPAGTSSLRYDSGSIISYTESPYTSSYNITASAWINKIPAFDASIIVIGGGAGGARGAGNVGAGYTVAGGGGGAGGIFQYDVSIMPNASYDIVSIGAAGTGSNTTSGQNGGRTEVKIWLGPIPQNGTASLLADGGTAGSASIYNGPGGASGGAGVLRGGEYLIVKPSLAGGAGATNDNAGGGGGVTQAGISGLFTPNGGINLGGGGGGGIGGGAPFGGSGSAFPTLYFHSSSFITITGSSGNGGNPNTNGQNASTFGGAGGGAGASTTVATYRGGDGFSGAVIVAYSGSAKLNVPEGTITTFQNGITSHLIKTTGSFSYVVEPKPNPEEQNYIWRAETLVIAGGGSGGTDEGGGGGAGGYSLNPYIYYEIGKTYSVIVGDGQPGVNQITASRSGSNSFITDSSNGQVILFAKGGGAGFAVDGGSGGGASNSGNGGGLLPGFVNPNYYITSSQTQGNTGGSADPSFAEAGGGGGAANSGSNGVYQPADPLSGMGGIGKYDLSFTPIGVCGGGNAWQRLDTPKTPNVAIFGGGDGCLNEPNSGSNAPANKGGGGGGARGVGNFGGAGGSGKVQIRYAGTQRATGGQIETGLISGSYYTLHTFTASGNFTPIR